MDSQPESVTSTLIRIARSLFGNPSRNVVNPVVTNVTGEEAGPLVVHCDSCWALVNGLAVVSVIFGAIYAYELYKKCQKRGPIERRISERELYEGSGVPIPQHIDVQHSVDGSITETSWTPEGDLIARRTFYPSRLVRRSIARRNSSFLRKVDEGISMIKVDLGISATPPAGQSPPGTQQTSAGPQSDEQARSLNAPTTSGVGVASAGNHCRAIVQYPSTSTVNSVIFPRGADIIIVHTPPGTSPVGSPPPGTSPVGSPPPGTSPVGSLERSIDAGPSPFHFSSTTGVIVVYNPPEESEEHNMSSPVSTENRSEIASGNSEVPTSGAPRVNPETNTLEDDSREDQLNSPERDIEAATPAKN